MHKNFRFFSELISMRNCPFSDKTIMMNNLRRLFCGIKKQKVSFRSIGALEKRQTRSQKGEMRKLRT